MKSLFALALTAACLGGCGQTGPLYLPKPTARPPVAQPAAVPAMPAAMTPIISTVPAQPGSSPPP